MAFNHCHGLRRVTLGNGLVEIDEYTFSYCKLIEVIIIPNAVRAIKVGAFCGCRGLMRVILGEGLEEIGMDAFRECTLMVEIVIPSSTKWRECRTLPTYLTYGIHRTNRQTDRPKD